MFSNKASVLPLFEHQQFSLYPVTGKHFLLCLFSALKFDFSGHFLFSINDLTQELVAEYIYEVTL